MQIPPNNPPITYTATELVALNPDPSSLPLEFLDDNLLLQMAEQIPHNQPSDEFVLCESLPPELSNSMIMVYTAHSNGILPPGSS